MERLDGNAIAGDLFDYFGAEMTTARGRCAHCGTVSQIAQQHVYARAPGAVVRCRVCGNVVMVLVNIGERLKIDSRYFALLEPQAGGPITES